MNDIHPSVVLQGDIHLGDGNIIGPGVTILGPVIIGNNNYLGPGVSLGGISRERLNPSHRLGDPLPGDASAVILGDRNMIFDHAVVHKPMFTETRIGNGVEIGAMSVVAHDCIVRDYSILSPHTCLGAYVTVGARANLGLGTGVHNRLTIGGYAMCGMGSVVVGHVPPSALAYGNPALIHGVNHVGLTRANFRDNEIAAMLTVLRDGTKDDLPPELEAARSIYAADVRRWPINKKEIRWSLPA